MRWKHDFIGYAYVALVAIADLVGVSAAAFVGL
jgi:hypothetical protein